MRRKLVVGNWKMNKTLPEALAMVEALINEVRSVADTEIAICPPFTAIDSVRHLARGTNVKVGAQDVFWAESGAFTGSISAGMLADLGCKFCIVGHSETRGRFGKLEIPESAIGYFAESDETVNLKLKNLLYHNVVPILCVGETLSEREEGRTDQVIIDQIRGALAGVDASEFHEGVIAYEPVRAIGTGKVCDTQEAERVCSTIRENLAAVLDAETADAVRILYGGSVKPNNARELFHQSNIDGGLVGGASLESGDFGRVVRSAEN
jgi:triosephosphate isomerase